MPRLRPTIPSLAAILRAIRVVVALAALTFPGSIMAENCPLAASLTLKDLQSGFAGETGTVWTIMPDCSFTVARQIGTRRREPHKKGHLTAEQQVRLRDMMGRISPDALPKQPGGPHANARRVTLSYGDREAALTLAPGRGDLSQLSADTTDPKAKTMLDLAAMMKDMLGG